MATKKNTNNFPNLVNGSVVIVNRVKYPVSDNPRYFKPVVVAPVFNTERASVIVVSSSNDFLNNMLGGFQQLNDAVENGSIYRKENIVPINRGSGIVPNLPRHNPSQVNWETENNNRRFVADNHSVQTPRNVRGVEYVTPENKRGNTGFKTPSWETTNNPEDKRTREYHKIKKVSYGRARDVPMNISDAAIKAVYGSLVDF